ncbi:hypothetical protein PTSG_07789 [Salpingoeca rosetta]|uniref:site-specific DNA-methyltransferase (cytosine-N(4)-specific) n=1 Tax=Salpingoeca rosetta (strain ATCC 50818 / BSB-021) TaxID=946362 RepID=F2UGC0_SALR5|nr:uncharacterized protein PTSG_07789 [Salpingoeca rosetta]EGD75670.1 hypothetical protein PTSG_07789 [Salpingoeca rosetta]|eukprot:XP_004991591.1 hypothetical protein PTSG_07789 [Salpingoeca rosetta]
MGGHGLELLNPPVVLRPHTCVRADGQQVQVHVFRDDVLPGGTKQRAMAQAVMTIAEQELGDASAVQEIVYAGPVEGFAQIAMAVVGKAMGIKATVFVASRRDRMLFHLTQRAKDQGADIHTVRPPNRLKDVQQAAQVYVQERQAAGHKTLLMPFGLHCPPFLDSLERQLRVALPRPVLEQPPRRLWLVAGSAAILEVLARIFPTTEFMVVQVGKTIWPDLRGIEKDGTQRYKSQLFVAEEKFWQVARFQPPYPSVRTYDAKLWQFVRQHAQPDDHVWNVASDYAVTRDASAHIHEQMVERCAAEAQLAARAGAFQWATLMVEMCKRYKQKIKDALPAIMQRGVAFGHVFHSDSVAAALAEKRLELAQYYGRKLTGFVKEFSHHFASSANSGSDAARAFAAFEQTCRTWLFVASRTFAMADPLANDPHSTSTSNNDGGRDGDDGCGGGDGDDGGDAVPRTPAVVNVFEASLQEVEAAGIDQAVLVSVLATLYAEGVLSFPWKRLYEGSPDTRMGSLRTHEATVDNDERRRPHNVRIYSRTHDGQPFLPLQFKGRCHTFVHDGGDYDSMDVLADFFQEGPRLRAVRKDQEASPLELWSRPAFVHGVVGDCLRKRGQITLYALREEVYTQVKECTQFKPSLAAAVMRLFRATRVLDFSAGWGDRLLGAIAADVTTYHAWDPNHTLKAGHDAMRRRFLPSDRLGDFQITYTGFEHAQLESSAYDLVFTSPPFFDFEVYTQLPGQSVNTYRGFVSWLVDFLLASIRRAWAALRPGGHCVIHITDVYKTRVCEPMCLLVLATLECVQYEGVLCSLGGMGRPRPLWVFRKLDATDTATKSHAWHELQRLHRDLYQYWNSKAPRQQQHHRQRGAVPSSSSSSSSSAAQAATRRQAAEASLGPANPSKRGNFS